MVWTAPSQNVSAIGSQMHLYAVQEKRDILKVIKKQSKRFVENSFAIIQYKMAAQNVYVCQRGKTAAKAMVFEL